MLRRLLAFLVFGISAASITAVAVAQEESDNPTDQPTETQGSAPEAAPPAAAPPSAPAKVQVDPVPAVKTETKAAGILEGWSTELHGYFRAPMALGISQRPDVVEGKPVEGGSKHLQLAYGSNRMIDWNYYSFAYTGVQEQDWAELFIHAKKKHVDAVVGWLGYWFGAVGYRNPDAAWSPGLAYVTLDTDFEMGGMKPNIAFTMGAFWPQFGYHQKYDTFTLGRFRMLGEQLKLTLPVNEDLTVKVYQGFGTNRDGTYNFTLQNANPLYAGKTGVDLVAYGHADVSYKDVFNVGLHYNYEFTRDPNITAQGNLTDGKVYSAARQAHLSVAGAEANLRLPYFGHLWLSPSFLSVKNGWALAGAGGTEVMNAQNGVGIAENYMGYSNTPLHSTGSGSMINLGFVYDNSISNIAPGYSGPDVKVSLFGLATKVSMDLPKLPDGTKLIITEKGYTQMKGGLDVTALLTDWMSTMLRVDHVIYNYNPDIRVADFEASGVENFKSSTDYKNSKADGYVFTSVTGRISFFSHFLSGETIFLQFSHYWYGDKMLLAGTWPWNTPLVAGTDVVQGNGGYTKLKPDANIIRLQAQVRF